MRQFACVVAFVTCLTASTGSAAVLISAFELGDDVVFRASGSLNLEGLGPRITGLTFAEPAIFPAFPAFNIGSGGPVDRFENAFDEPLVTFGDSRPGEPFFAQVSRGNTIGVSRQTAPDPTSFLIVEPGYTSGTEFTGSLRFLSTNFGELGLIRGTYTWTLTNDDTVTLSQIPLPAGVWLSLGALGILGSLSWAARRRQAATDVCT